VIGATIWAAYLCLVLIVAVYVILWGKPILTGLDRYRYQGRHWQHRVQRHEHRAYLVQDGVAYCECGEEKRLADGNYPQAE
jgi:hypothetical protein